MGPSRREPVAVGRDQADLRASPVRSCAASPQQTGSWLAAAMLALILGLASSGCATATALGAGDPADGFRAPFMRVVRHDASNALIQNPERGFYGWANSMWLGPELSTVTADGLRSLPSKGVTLVRVYYVIDEFREAPLSAAALERVRADFDAIREAGLKMIPRFAYNFPIEGSNQVIEDASLERVLDHIDQLAPILRANSDVIAFMEAGFVGAWGEWHSSSNGLLDNDGGANDRSRAILERLLSVLPGTRTVALRYPHLKQRLFGTEPLTPADAFTGTSRARVGAHNDCFLRDGVDSGTYSRPGQYVPPSAFIEAQKQYLHLDNRFVPQGGETCGADVVARPYFSCRNALSEFERLRWSTINLGYHPDVIAAWQREGCFDDIQRRLGYRLRLTRAEVPAAASAGGPLRLSFTVTNDGWASPYNPRRVELILRHHTGYQHVIAVDADPRRWGAGETHRVVIEEQLPDILPTGAYRVLLNLPDPEPRLHHRAAYSIRLANKGVWEEATGFNDLKASITIACCK